MKLGGMDQAKQTPHLPTHAQTHTKSFHFGFCAKFSEATTNYRLHSK
jgi:hypothetical protein